MVTPVKVGVLKQYLLNSNYDKEKTGYLINGFENGFNLGYRGPKNVKMTSKNLRFVVGDEIELWNKVMKEVELKRYAGPFRSIPFDNYNGLVPKDGNKTRLIFHLSYPRDGELSVNYNTPKELCSVKYPDFEDAVRLCLQWGDALKCYGAKSDLTSAFRHICIAKRYWKYLIMKAKSPIDGRFYYFIDKCLPFGASISCAIFQAFSDALSHITRYVTEHENINYLDDFFFTALLKVACDLQIKQFLDICSKINFPVSMEKTCWGSRLVVFLGLLLDMEKQLVCIPMEKVDKARRLIQNMLGITKSRRKTTVGEMQKLTGFLNFLCKAIVPGRVFMRRLYHQTALKKYHHIPLNHERREDLKMWLLFLNNSAAYSRPFWDFDTDNTAEDLDWYTDASTTLGCGGYYGSHWFIAEWEPKFKHLKPSINYMELYALCVSVLNWLHLVKNKRVTLFCDNMSVVQMVNKFSSSCKNCMFLLRLIMGKCLIYNVKLRVKHVTSQDNKFADLLSRLKYREFRKLARSSNKYFEGKCTELPQQIWPPQKVWIKNKEPSRPKTKTLSNSRKKNKSTDRKY